MIDIRAIRRNPEQPRKVFESEALEELRDSIERHGVLQPICVRRVGSGFEIISGERRWRAARNAGLDLIPAVVREDVADDVSLELALVENVQREDLDPIEKAEGYRSLMDRVGLTQEQIAERLGLKRSSVANQLRLLDLPTEGQDAVREGLISMGHAKALLSIRGADSLRKALQEIVRKDLSVREAERLARAGSAKGASAKAPAESSTSSAPAWVGDMERRLRSALGVKVSLRSGKGYRGSIQLDFAGREELDRLCDLLAPKDTI
ncbi:MAG: ParB/RepB/Spo0J family partition protein [Planctomycetota bacterium]